MSETFYQKIYSSEIDPMEELIPGLPDEIGLECLTRLPYTVHPVAALVSRTWKNLLESPDFFNLRKQAGKTHKLACLVHSLPVQPGPAVQKPAGPPTYGIAVFDLVSGTWERIDPIPKYPKGVPLFCRVASVERKLVVMGGWDPASFDPVKDVFVYDFVTRKWTQGKDMPSKRSFFGLGTVAGRVFVAGGHDEGKNALRSAWAYDVNRDEWSELTQMSEERDECEGVVVGNEFWVVSGYGTEDQGRFKESVEAYELGTGQWRRIDSGWVANRCPRGCVGGVGPDGKLVCLGDVHQAVRVGVYAVGLGEGVLVTGSASQGEPVGFYMMEGQNGKLGRVDVAAELTGFVQSGCCLEL